ncbi:hypothetical protein O7623_03710 [Solwaraspora sp. WMMD791]|uniref:hypothetical protein n=1 Tax=Solwaraspora sp. WMMD791 TaxID=3016086 RepID=UPI00249C7B53|nr:hypothetical protein [Solwaraspora sp. WMMD791]WFE28329.1 hypothetical protein O7623_03710 [Solwaraspora sp. WMMD791]
MIVVDASAQVSVIAGVAEAGWQCLIRRGMLHSECEGVELWDLPVGGTLPVRAAHGVEEAVLVLVGAAAFVADHGTPVRAGAGQVLLLPYGAQGEIRADGGSRLLTIRALAGEVSRALPPRIPELAPA